MFLSTSVDEDDGDDDDEKSQLNVEVRCSEIAFEAI